MFQPPDCFSSRFSKCSTSTKSHSWRISPAKVQWGNLELTFSAKVYSSSPGCASTSRNLGWQHAAGNSETSERDPLITGGSRTKQPTLLLSNIRSILGQVGKTKVQFLSDQALQQNAVAVAVTESWLHPDVKDSEVTINKIGLL